MVSDPSHIEELEGEIRRQKHRLVKTHQYTKKLLLLSEELGPAGKNFFQVIKEHRDAHEHMMRALNAELIENDREKALRYILSNLKAAHGHEVRAFFDIADYIDLIIRDNVTGLLDRFEYEAIGHVIPEYYEEWRTKILDFERSIAEVRGGKDMAAIERDEDNDIDRYHGIVVNLVDIWLKISERQSEGHQRLEALSLLGQAKTELNTEFSSNATLSVRRDFFEKQLLDLEERTKAGDVDVVGVEREIEDLKEVSEAWFLVDHTIAEMTDRYSDDVIRSVIPYFFEEQLRDFDRLLKNGDVGEVNKRLDQLAEHSRGLETAHRIEKRKIAGNRRFTLGNLIFAATLTLLVGLIIAYVSFWLQQAAQDRASPEKVEDSGNPGVVEQQAPEPDQN